MLEIFVQYSELLSTIFLGLTGGFFAILSEKRTTILRIFKHLFFGVISAQYVGPAFCVWKGIGNCHFWQIVSACVGLYFWMFIIGIAQTIFNHRNEIGKTIAQKYIDKWKRSK